MATPSVPGSAPTVRPFPQGEGVVPLRYQSGELLLLDQRQLPESVEWIACRDASTTARAIADMVVRGAPAIGVSAAYGVALEALRHRDEAPASFAAALEHGIATLASSRPTAVNLFWALAQMRRAWAGVAGQPTTTIAATLEDAAGALHADDLAANRALGDYGAPLLPEGARVLTHCNAGALATAGYGTALGVVRSAVAAGKAVSVVADETRPFLQGARLTAWELLQDQIPVTLITDNMSGHLMARGEIDAVIVGADRVAANGDVANKIGTYMVAVLAREHGIPFYVACPTSTIDPDLADGGEIPIEERAEEEVRGFAAQRWAPAGVPARHPAFDVTPARLVTALITEKGVLSAPRRESIASLLGQS